MESRVDRLEREVERLAGDVQKVRDQIGDLHNSSMAFVTATFAAMEHRLTDRMDAQVRDLGNKIDQQATTSGSERLLILSGAFGWVITLGVVIFEAWVHH